jgi:hypothetical protein
MNLLFNDVLVSRTLLLLEASNLVTDPLKFLEERGSSIYTTVRFLFCTCQSPAGLYGRGALRFFKMWKSLTICLRIIPGGKIDFGKCPV